MPQKANLSHFFRDKSASERYIWEVFFINNKFYYAVFPLNLLYDEKYKHFSSKEFLLYTLLLNRMNIAKKNLDSFSDSKGVFIYYSISTVEKDLRCSKSTAINVMNKLENAGLIHRERQANGLPNKIYVKDLKNFNAKKEKTIEKANSTIASENVSFDTALTNEFFKKARRDFGTKKNRKRTR